MDVLSRPGWAVVCPSGIVRHQGIRNLRSARSLANDAAFTCICRELGHKAVSEKTGRAYEAHRRPDGTDRRNRGINACALCGETGHDRRDKRHVNSAVDHGHRA